MSQQFTHDELEDMLDRCIDEGKLSDWESSFVTSIKDQFDRSGHLSPKQIEILERIYIEKVP